MRLHLHDWVHAHLLTWYCSVLIFIQGTSFLFSWFTVRRHRELYLSYEKITKIQGDLIKIQNERITRLEQRNERGF